MNQPYLESSEKSQSYVLMIQINQLSIIIDRLQICKCLFIDAYIAAPIYLGYN